MSGGPQANKTFCIVRSFRQYSDRWYCSMGDNIKSTANSSPWAIYKALLNSGVRCGTMLLKHVMADMEIQLGDNISTVHRRVQWHIEMTHDLVECTKNDKCCGVTNMCIISHFRYGGVVTPPCRAWHGHISYRCQQGKYIDGPKCSGPRIRKWQWWT